MSSAFTRGTSVGGFTIYAKIHCGENSDIYQARRADGLLAALKVTAAGNYARLEYESAVLARLTNCATPEVFTLSTAGADHFLALTWRPGIEVRQAASELRDLADRSDVLRMCVRVVRAYAEIHERGVVHGHVHPRNLLIDGDGLVSVLDFGPRAGQLGLLSAPAQAKAWLSTGQTSTPDARDEQYSLAALVYLLVTGKTPFGSERRRDAVARQILTAPAQPFADQGVPQWPRLEAVLACAMSKDPSRRFPALGSLADALEGALTQAVPKARPSAPQVELSPALDALHGDFLQQTRADGPLLADGLATAPRCSVNNGAAGIAFSLYRFWRLLGDAELMRAAKAWLARAEHDRHFPGAFYEGAEFTPEVFGRVSPYHTESGLALVSGLISRACGDLSAEQEAIGAFLASTDMPCRNPDLTLGRCSIVLGAAILLNGADQAWPQTQRLIRRGDELLAEIWRDLPAIGIRHLGIAHGWAGIVYATLAWSRARGLAPPPAAHKLLEDIKRRSEPRGRGMCWPVGIDEASGDGAYTSGWCNGHAGHVFVWTLAADTYGEPGLMGYAERAAWSTYDEPCGVTSLCCGAAGEVYALLNLYRSTGEHVWLSRATARANLAASTAGLAQDARSPLSLYKGHTGLALLAAELRCPELAAMPLFEPEPAL